MQTTSLLLSLFSTIELLVELSPSSPIFLAFAVQIFLLDSPPPPSPRYERLSSLGYLLQRSPTPLLVKKNNKKLQTTESKVDLFEGYLEYTSLHFLPILYLQNEYPRLSQDPAS